MRKIAAVIGGIVVWAVVATLINLALRYGWPAYAEVEKAMTLTLAMMIARLILSAVASVCAGAAAAAIAKRNDRVVMILAGLLFVVFVPVHYQLWNAFPLWYHVSFFVLLVGMIFVGAALYRRSAIS
jgi:ABC-type dipeptide/oligopeptide/nickel transport system permease component